MRRLVYYEDCGWDLGEYAVTSDRRIPGGSDPSDARTSVDPWSTFLLGAAAADTAGSALAAVLRRLLRDDPETQAQSRHFRTITNDSFSVLLFLADGQTYEESDISDALALPGEQARGAIDSLLSTDLISRHDTTGGIKLTHRGRSALKRISSQLAS